MRPIAIPVVLRKRMPELAAAEMTRHMAMDLWREPDDLPGPRREQEAAQGGCRSWALWSLGFDYASLAEYGPGPSCRLGCLKELSHDCDQGILPGCATSKRS